MLLLPQKFEISRLDRSRHSISAVHPKNKESKSTRPSHAVGIVKSHVPAVSERRGLIIVANGQPEGLAIDTKGRAWRGTDKPRQRFGVCYCSSRHRPTPATPFSSFFEPLRSRRIISLKTGSGGLTREPVDIRSIGKRNDVTVETSLRPDTRRFSDTPRRDPPVSPSARLPFPTTALSHPRNGVLGTIYGRCITAALAELFRSSLFSR